MGISAKALFCAALSLLVISLAPQAVLAEAIIIDHNCIDLSAIPPEWVSAAQEQMKLHYGHTSHGSQLITGLERLEAFDPTFDVAIGYAELPAEQGALCIYNVDNDPDGYYANTQSILNGVEALNVSMFGWCCQGDYDDWQDYLNDYLSNMQAFEAANPDVTFIYMTGNAQSDGATGYNRFQFNKEIRTFCRDNDKVLFDFEDLDSWYNGEQNTYRYNRNDIPLQHPHFDGDEAGHTTYESCEQKGRAVWWAMARLAGWDPNAGQEPYIELRANGELESLGVGCDEPVTVTLSLGDNGCSTPPYELWLAANTPFGWFSYVYPTGWQAGLAPTIDFGQDGMVDLADYALFQGCLSAPGDYTFYAALDTNLDDAPADIDVLDYVTVQSATE